PSAAGSRSARSCRWARRASAALVSTNGSAAHRHEPDPPSEERPGDLTRCHERVPGDERKRRLMTIKLVALVLLCLMTCTAGAQPPEVTALVSKDLPRNPGPGALVVTHLP